VASIKCAILCDLKPSDEVIVPSYTFVSTALPFLREGAKVVFADSMKRNPNFDAETLVRLPRFYDLEVGQVEEICRLIDECCKEQS